MRYLLFSVIPTLALSVALPPFSQDIKNFIWRPGFDLFEQYSPGIIHIKNRCNQPAFFSEVWQNGGHGPWPVLPHQITEIPLRDDVGGVDVKFARSPSPPQNPVELSYAFDPSDTSFNFDLVTITPHPDFDGRVVIYPAQSGGQCQAEYWEPGQPPYPPGQEVCPAGTDLFVLLC